jgi:hypothetical protein
MGNVRVRLSFNLNLNLNTNIKANDIWDEALALWLLL